MQGDGSEADQNAYRQLSANATKGVAIVTARHRGWDIAATVTDHLSVTYDPPTMLVSLYSLSRMADALAESDHWALSLLSAGQRPVADSLAEPGNPLVGLLDQIPHFRRGADGPPIIAGSLAWFQLQTVARFEVATHTLFVGRVEAMGEATATERAPLVRFRSGYRAH